MTNKKKEDAEGDEGSGGLHTVPPQYERYQAMLAMHVPRGVSAVIIGVVVVVVIVSVVSVLVCEN
jgi:hypothetical protein